MSSSLGNILFMFNNSAQRGTIATSSEASSDLAASNLKSPFRSEIWRSDNLSDQQTIDIILDENEEAPAGIAALVDCNLTTTGTVRLQSFTDAVGGIAGSIDVTVNAWEVLEGYSVGQYGFGGYGGAPTAQTLALIKPILFVSFPNWSSDRYWRFTLTDPNTTYKETAVPYIGTYWQPTSNYNWGASKQLEYRTKTIQSRGGQRYGNSKQPKLILSAQLEDIDTAQADYLWLKHLELGDNVPFLCSFKPDGNLGQLFTSIYCTFASSQMSDEYVGHQRTAIRLVEEL